MKKLFLLLTFVAMVTLVGCGKTEEVKMSNDDGFKDILEEDILVEDILVEDILVEESIE